MEVELHVTATSTNQGAYARIAPVVLALAPIGLLFGILAGQADWSWVEVFLMSLLGFTGSGQFAYLGFAHPDNQHIEYITVFLIILGINLRYIPMTLSASHSMVAGAFGKAILSHALTDESYAVEQPGDGLKEKTIIRLAVVIFWTLSTSCGVLLSAILPTTASQLLAGLTFPINAILILLSWTNIFAFVDIDARTEPKFSHRNKKVWMVAFCICTSMLCIVMIGPKYFWLPSIALNYFTLTRYAAT